MENPSVPRDTFATARVEIDLQAVPKFQRSAVQISKIQRTRKLFCKSRIILCLSALAAFGSPAIAVSNDQDDTLPAAAMPLIKQLPEEDQYFQNIARSGFYSFKNAPQPLRVYLKPSSAKVSPELQAALQSAFDVWTKASKERLKFQFVKVDNDPDITVVWTNNPGDIKEGKQGYTDFVKTKDDISKSKITLLTNRRNGMPLTAPFAKALVMHEIGHAIGLNGHSYSSGDIMFGGRLEDTSHISASDLKFFNKIYTTPREELLKDTLPVLEKIYGSDSLIVSKNMARLARIYNNKKQFALAEPYAEKALPVQEKELPENDKNYLTTLSTAAFAYWNLNKFDKACPCYETMLRLKRKGVDIYLTEEQLYRNIVRCREEQKQTDKMLEALNEMQSTFEKSNPQGEGRAWAMAKLGYFEFQNGQKEKAKPLMKAACDIYTRVPSSKFGSWCINFYKSQFTGP